MVKRTSGASTIIPAERIQRCIYVIRGRKVLLDEDLATLYGVQTRVLNQAVSRNAERFPEDFMFRLNAAEFANLKSQNVTSSWGGRRKLPRAFTEQGVAMLSSVLRSPRAISVNIAIMRTFVRLREILADNADLRRKIEQHDIRTLFLPDGQEAYIGGRAGNELERGTLSDDNAADCGNGTEGKGSVPDLRGPSDRRRVYAGRETRGDRRRQCGGAHPACISQRGAIQVDSRWCDDCRP